MLATSGSVEKRAAGRLAARQIVDCLTRVRVRAEGEHDRVGATLPMQQRALEQPVVLTQALIWRVGSGGHVARDRLDRLG
jgi:hypothetical protein